MILDGITATVNEMVTVRRVYGEPYERDGVTIVPAAVVSGGGGGGGGEDAEGRDGHGGGLGVSARPAGVYVIADGTVRWRPAVDVNRAVAALSAVAVVAIVARVRLVRLRMRPRRTLRRTDTPG